MDADFLIVKKEHIIISPLDDWEFSYNQEGTYNYYHITNFIINLYEQDKLYFWTI